MDRIIDDIAGQRARAPNGVTFYQDEGVRSCSLSDLDELALDLAARLSHQGLRRGDRIGIVARNRLEWVLLDLAAIKLGLVTAGFEHGRFAPTKALIEAYGLKLVFTDQDVKADGVVDIRALTRELGNPGRRAGPLLHYGEDDVTTIKFTSGSTGQPKGLAPTVASIDSSISAVQSMFHHGGADKVFVFLPLSLLQQRYWIYSALHYGHDVIVATYELAFYAMKRERPTVIMGVPSFYDAVQKQIEAKLRAQQCQTAPAEGPVAPAADALRLRRRCADEIWGGRIRYLWTGSAPARPAMLHFFFDCGVPIYEGYGMNETCIVSKNHEGATKIGSAGRVVARKEVYVGEDSVLMVRSRYPVNTRYLFCAPGESEKIFLPNGDVRTGDVGYVDDDGYLHILGRADDMIPLGNGKNVMVRPIEERLKDHPAIEECVLVGAGRPYLLAVVAGTGGSKDEVAAHIDRLNQSLGKDERIGGFVLAREGFTIANGLLTSQYKPKRKEILSRYRVEIDGAYGGNRWQMSSSS